MMNEDQNAPLLRDYVMKPIRELFCNISTFCIVFVNVHVVESFIIWGFCFFFVFIQQPYFSA